MKSMNDLLLHFAQDILYAEKAGAKVYAKVAKAVENEDLKAALLQHREQGQAQIERLEHVFEALGKRPRGKTCAAMDGLIEEGQDAIEEADKGPVLDAALIACSQAVEHYEIARYGAMVAFAKQLGLDEAAGLLQQTLDEEKAMDRRLNEIAEGSLNQEASEASGEDDDEEDEGEEEPKAGSTGGDKEETPKTRTRAKPRK